MVLTLSMYKVCASIGGSSDAIPKAGDSRHGAHTIVHGDTARVAVDNHTSARSRRTKSNSALQPQTYVDDKPARTHSRAAVPKSDKDERPSGRKSSRGMKPRRGRQATKQSRGSKTSARIAGLSGDSVADGLQEQGHPRRSGKTGTKRSRESEEDASDPEAILRANTRHVRRRIHGPADQAVQRDVIVPGIYPANECDVESSCQAPRRSARLASKSSNPVPQDLCSLAVSTEHVVDWCIQTRRKRTRAQECNENEPEESNVRRMRRRIREAVDQSEVETEGRTSGSDSKTESSEETLVKNGSNPSNVDRPGRNEEGSAPTPLVKVEDIDQDWLLCVDNERHASVETVTSVYWKNRESTEPRSSSVESLLTPPPPCMEEEEEVLLHHDFDAMIPLESLPDEDERNALDRAYLRQQQEHGPDETYVEAEMAANRYRSLAPEPDQGLVDAIRSGRISGLASPERSMRAIDA